MCVFGRLLLLYRVRFLFFFVAFAFSSPLTTIQQTIRRGGRGENFVENSVYTIYSLEQIPHVNTLELEM
jgi:hypothetical protein